ncbi:MAG: DUF6691 family protein [Planctomycetaceae bacterium]
MEARSATAGEPARRGLLVYLILGTAFGVLLVKSEVVSWWRIQEMFRFQSFHMYGIIGSAVVVAAISVALMRRLFPRTLRGEPIRIPRKTMGKGVRYIAGGAIFGLGWGLLGACPGPMFALLGHGMTVMAAAIVSAVAGTWLYGAVRPRLPH